MHRKTPVILTLAILAGAAFATAAAARPFGGPRHGPGPDPAGFIAHHAERLGLDEDTRRRIDELVRASRDEARGLRDELHDAHGRLRELLSADLPDEAAVLAQAVTIGGLETELHKSRLRALLQIRALLTPEQRAELERIREEGPFARFEATRQVCADDMARLCPDAPVDEPHSLFCLKGHRGELSDACGDALREMRRERRHHWRSPDEE